MRGGTQFSILTLLGTMAAAGLFLSTQNIWIHLILFEIIGVLLTVEFLIRQLPNGIREMAKRNCQRLDGSFSQRRQSVENKAVRFLRTNLCFLCFTIVLPLNIGIWFAISHVSYGGQQNLPSENVVVPVPGPIATSVNQSFNAEMPREALIFLSLATAVTLVVGFIVFRSGYMYFLTQFVSEMKQRKRNYTIRDLDILSPSNRIIRNTPSHAIDNLSIANGD